MLVLIADICFSSNDSLTSLTHPRGRQTGHSAIGNFDRDSSERSDHRHCSAPPDQSRTLRIGVNVSRDDQKMLVRFHGKTLEPSLVQMSAAGIGVMHVMPPCMRHRHPCHHAQKRLAISRPQQQVPVIVHEAEGEQIDVEASERLAEEFDERLEVGVLAEEVASAVASVQNMIDDAGFDPADVSGHSEKEDSGTAQIDQGDPFGPRPFTCDCR